MNSKKYYVEPEQMLAIMKKRQRNIRVEVPENLIILLSGSMSSKIGGVEWSEIQNFFYMKIQHLKDQNIAAVSNLGFGSPAAALGLELLIAAGAKRIICFGTAGALTNDLESGRIVVCDKAYRDEGVSRHYVDLQSGDGHWNDRHLVDEFTRPDEVLFQSINESCAELGFQSSIVSSWTTDAIFRESVDEARKIFMKGVRCVEMEASALFSVAQCRQVQLACLFAISDHLVDGEWTPNFQHAHDRYDDLMRVAIASLRR
jgi:uridine phosphorylase